MAAVSVERLLFFSRDYTLGINPTQFQTNWVQGLGVIAISSWESLLGPTLVLGNQKSSV